MFKGVVTRLWASLLTLMASSGLAVFLCLEGRLLFGGLFALLAVVMVWTVLRLYHYNTRKITFMFNAVENNDYAFRFTEYESSVHDNLFNMALNRIKQLLVRAKKEAAEREKYYELILNNVTTGIIVFDDRGSVIQINGEVLRLIGLSVFTHIDQLRRVYEPLPEVFRSLVPGQSVTVTFHNERGAVNLSLLASEAVIRDRPLRIVAVNDIDRELDEKEVESWIRLTRVLTHEIMNAVTPVASLSDTLLGMYADKDDDLYKGLDAINTTSRGLLSFVESYREFTRIPMPEMRPLPVLHFLERIVMLAREDFPSRDMPVRIEAPADLTVQADENLMTRVVLNLLKNAVAAIGERADGTIRIAARRDGTHTLVEIANNGDVIPPEEADHIFVPFFTTKQDGSGIGLSISRQIMRLHNGSIRLKSSTPEETCFVLTFR